MKKLVLAVLVTCGAAMAAFGQGSLVWGNNFTGFRAVIFDVQTDNPTLSLYGQSGGFYGGTTTGAQDTPVGTVTYNGLLLSGTKYTFAVFVAPTATLSNSLQLLGQTTFNTSSSTINGGNVFPKGYVPQTTSTVAGVTANQTAVYQVRVWNNQNGTLTSWALAEAAWLAGATVAGVSPILTSGPLGGIDPGGNVNGINPTTSGFLSFNLYNIPEPSVMALAGLGMAALLLRRRSR